MTDRTDDLLDAAMAAVWALVRSGPNFDGRDKDVRRAIQAYGDACVDAATKRQPAAQHAGATPLRQQLEHFAIFDGDGIVEPREPFTWETLARVAVDLANATLARLAAQAEKPALDVAVDKAWGRFCNAMGPDSPYGATQAAPSAPAAAQLQIDLDCVTRQRDETAEKLAELQDRLQRLTWGKQPAPVPAVSATAAPVEPQAVELPALPDFKPVWQHIMTVDGTKRVAVYNALCDMLQTYAREAVSAAQAAPSAPAPIPMVLHCPKCGMQHVDKPDGQFYPGMTADESVAQNAAYGLWDNPPHRSHLCHSCKHIWRPADVPTTGVQVVQTTGTADSPIASPTTAPAVPWHNPRADKLRDALRDIADSKSLTATPTQFYQHLQRAACRALTDDAMDEPAAPAVPVASEGWRLVPVVSTDAMEQAAADYLGAFVKAGELWDVMLAAAPNTP